MGALAPFSYLVSQYNLLLKTSMSECFACFEGGRSQSVMFVAFAWVKQHKLLERDE